MKRFSIVLALTVALCLAFVGSAYANFGPHGGYVNDTDACAGCHRAHTSFSPITFTSNDGFGTQITALLVGNATTITQFCDACHGDTAPGASTNVVSGVFDAGPSAGTGGNTLGAGAIAAGYPGDSPAQAVLYTTASTFGAPLNGGGFVRMPDPYAWQGLPSLGGTGPNNPLNSLIFVGTTSSHHMDTTGPIWGNGSAISTFGGAPGMTCVDCHDPHGSSNYRLLKAQPYPGGVTVGGYQPDGVTPNPFVFSDEIGYPVPSGTAYTTGADGNGGAVVYGTAPGGGWLKHADGAAQMDAYEPNYTQTSGTPILSFGDPTKSMSVWCSACHTQYNQGTSSYDYGKYMPGAAGLNTALSGSFGAQTYHRHKVDVNLAVTVSPMNPLALPTVSDAAFLPLENSAVSDPTEFSNNYIGCLTCHRAHGASATMTGWASAYLSQIPVNTGSGPITNVYMPVLDVAVAGVSPDRGEYGTGDNKGTSALLRANNRGVCERCHNK